MGSQFERRELRILLALVREALATCVDMLEGAEGPLLMEVNASPGLEGIEKATGVDIAGEIIGFLERHARHGETGTKGKG